MKTRVLQIEVSEADALRIEQAGGKVRLVIGNGVGGGVFDSRRQSNPGSACPLATRDLEANTRNRDAAIRADYIQYGPLYVDSPGDYWQRLAAHWNTPVSSAKQALCGNCVAFDVSPRMDACMPGPISDKDGRLGYCWMHHFKCHSARTCRTWAKGGPITHNNVSDEWQRRSESK